ncbi:MAG: hypothetical protein HY591_05530 [Candidatus Omnitrophica bacterium]|nr:hypothetical protein [Candidatus Omnitrophota bacterium]
MAVITFPKILNDRLTDEGARALADILDRVVLAESWMIKALDPSVVSKTA